MTEEPSNPRASHSIPDHELDVDGAGSGFPALIRRFTRTRRQLTGSQLLVVSFAALILIGTLALRFAPGLYRDARLGWVDSLFTATSAVCVTGLTVADTATRFTPAGQYLILLLIQLGGIGIMTLSTSIILALGGRLSLGHEEVATPLPGPLSGSRMQQLSRNVIVYTIGLEIVGTLILTMIWLPRFGFPKALNHALFQAVSAFCNAGFSTFSDSLESWSSSPATLITISALIVLGGLGFLTLHEISPLPFRRSHRKHISLHSKLVLVTTLVLIVFGWIVYAALDWNQGLAHLEPHDRITNSLFMSVTARTAGFNSIDYTNVSPGGDFFTILLMMVGGSPGSTAGGLKTTTCAIILLLAWTRLRGHRFTQVFNRTIPDETVQRAVGLFVVVGFVIVTAVFIFAAVEEGGPHDPNLEYGFLRHSFEAVSAFNTVGLSLGVTQELSTTGRLLTVLLMFLGRVGPLTFAAAIIQKARTRQSPVRFAKEDVSIG